MKSVVAAFGLVFLFVESVLCLSTDFVAYYTHIRTADAFEQYAKVGDYGDIVVSLPARGKFVFWRGSSYLPYWQPTGSVQKYYVPEIVPRSGNGSVPRTDLNCDLSSVRIIERTDTSATVHWRYTPAFGGGNPYTGMSKTNTVDEYFTISSTGTVHRSVRKGSAKFDDWNDPLNRTKQDLSLTMSGVAISNTVLPTRSPVSRPSISGNTIKTPPASPNPALWWKFDEALIATRDSAAESITGAVGIINGHKSLWRKGVSGTCLQFDGYWSNVSCASKPDITNALTCEAWVALAAYPWNCTPIVENRQANAGYALEITDKGEVSFSVANGGQWKKVTAAARLPVYQWHHVAGVFNGTTGISAIYVNGSQVAQSNVGTGSITVAQAALRIGQGPDLSPTNTLRVAYAAPSVIDGLLDEVRVYASALTTAQVQSSYNAFNPGSPVTLNPDIEKRVLPGYPGAAARFGARYTTLNYHSSWDYTWRVGQHADVVIDFDAFPWKFVVWRGTGYLPHTVSDNNIWENNQSLEHFGTGDASTTGECYETMSDKACNFNSVRIIENTPARSVVHIRYPLLGPSNKFSIVKNGWPEYADEYYFAYPDGVMLRKLVDWKNDGGHPNDFQETIVTLGAGQTPDSAIDIAGTTLILADINGQSVNYSWANGTPAGVGPANPVVQMVRLRGASYHPYIGIDPASSKVDLINWGSAPGQKINWYNHWPVADIPNDGRNAWFFDRESHSCLSAVRFNYYEQNKPYDIKLALVGNSNQPPAVLSQIVRAWVSPPALQSMTGATGTYDKAQRAYILRNTGNGAISFSLNGSSAAPVINPSIIVHGWGSKSDGQISVDGVVQTTGSNFRQGVSIDTAGDYALAIWVKKNTTVPVSISISRGAISGTVSPLFPLSAESATGFSFSGLSGKSNVISYTIPQSMRITVKLYTIQGKLLKTLCDAQQQPGHYDLSVETGGLSSGMYLLKIKAGDFACEKKLRAYP